MNNTSILPPYIIVRAHSADLLRERVTEQIMLYCPLGGVFVAAGSYGANGVLEYGQAMLLHDYRKSPETWNHPHQ